MAAGTIEYLSWSAFLVTSPGGVRVLIDPWISGSDESKVPPAKRSVEDLAQVVDLMLLTHAANDHRGQAFAILSAGKATLGASIDVRILAGEAGIAASRMVSMVPNSPYVTGDVTVIPVEAKHLSSSQLASGQWLIGQPLSYFVKFGDGTGLFHSGDTAITLDLGLWAELYQPTVALLAIGGLIHGTKQPVIEMSPREAALTAKMMKVQAVVPCHYAPDARLQAEVSDCVRELAPGIRPVVLAPGESMEISASGPHR